jgi:hypothetical protein
MYMCWVTRMDHLRSVEPPSRNMQQCCAHVDVEEGDGA